ncbi:MAG: sulfatase-like hydrolase/transferase [Planctomycetota bacterium]|jgi:arylsulfatase A-like enzyme
MPRLMTAVLLLASISLPALAAERPNILFIYTDDQAYRTISAYPEAFDWVDTPNVDRLAEQGVRFTHAYIGSWCMASRATMLTGHLQHGIESMRMEGTYPGSTYDPAEAPFWPAHFRKNGYQTAQIGKWHTGTDSGYGRDWDYQVVWNRPKYPENAGNYFDDQLIETNGGPPVMTKGYTTDWYTDKAVEYIHGANREAGKPWYLWVCYGAVHGPFLPAERHESAYEDVVIPVPQDIYPPRPGKPTYASEMKFWNEGPDGVPELKSGINQRTVSVMSLHGNNIHQWVRQYHQGVLAIDEAVGRMSEALEATGQTENTLVVFTSDQGLAWGQHGFRHTLAPYDSNIRAPLIFSMPGTLPQGTVVKSPVGGQDIPPTFYAFAGLKTPWKMHGHDLTPLLKDPNVNWPHPTLMTLTGEVYGSDSDRIPAPDEDTFTIAGIPWWVSLADGRVKYIRTLIEGEPEELYDLKNDPDELVNLAMDPKHAGLLNKMRAAAIKELKRTGAGYADGMPKAGTE